MAEKFNSVLNYFNENLKGVLNLVSYRIKCQTQEIRLRKDLPLSLTVAGESLFLKQDGQTCKKPDNYLVKVSQRDILDSFSRLCNNSVFAHENELKRGFIKLKNGSRAGIFGTVNNDGLIRDITSLNIRIAREVYGAANDISSQFSGEGWLIAGPPGSGKTTVLRDLVRQISCGTCGKVYRVSVIDTRGEISGAGGNDLGFTTDVLNIEEKARGLEIAVRTMFPQVVAFDEIGTVAELNKVSESFNAGVIVITTAHLESIDEIFKRDITCKLLKSGAVKKIAFLPKVIGEKIKIFKVDDLIDNLS